MVHQYLCYYVLCHIHIKYITQARGTATYTMSQVQPALRGLEWVRTLAVLDLHDGVVVTGIDDLLLLDLGVLELHRDVASERIVRDQPEGRGLRVELRRVLPALQRERAPAEVPASVELP